MTTKTTATDIHRTAQREWVPLNKMTVAPLAQRDLKKAWVDHLVRNFNPEAVGALTVSERDGHYYIVDGQNRAAAMRVIGWADQRVECDVYRGLTLEQEADLFLWLNHRLNVDTLASFHIAVTAGRNVESDIDRIVQKNGLKVSREKTNGAVGAVGTLRRIYNRGGPIGAELLDRTLHITYESFGDYGLSSTVIDGVAFLCERYETKFTDDEAIAAFRAVKSGVSAIRARSEHFHKQTGNAKGHCVAAALVEAINRQRRTGKLHGWFKEQ